MPSENTYAPYSSKREQRLVYFFVCVGIISLTYALFYVIDFLPEKEKGAVEVNAPIETDAVHDADTVVAQEGANVSHDSNAGGETPVSIVDSALPQTIIFDSLDGKKVNVLNPKSATVEALDNALLSGVVRHPDSADFAHTGTLFLLGHSSYLPNVMNKNFQAFNGIQKLKWGDTIRLRSKDMEYVYSVDRVYQAKASDAEVQIQHDEARLVLATCNSFATKDDRFIVEATLLESHKL